MEKKYIIYKNDLKFKNERNINFDKIDWEQNDIKHLIKIDHDSLEYRINESKNTNYNDFDLELMNLNVIPDIIKNNIFLNLKHLFLSNNNLSDLIDLSFLKSLEILDLTNNNITKIIIPDSLVELSICKNNLTEFISNNKIKRLRISNNKIKKLVISNNIEILEANNNLINDYDFSNFKKLNKLIIYSNPLLSIKFPPECTYIDLSETNINCIDNLYKIEHLVLNKCINIKNLPLSDNLKTLEIIETPIDKLYFYSNYELILLQLNLTQNVSSKYKKSNANIQIRKNTFLVISKGVNLL
jgi:hypothetical protein